MAKCKRDERGTNVIFLADVRIPGVLQSAVLFGACAKPDAEKLHCTNSRDAGCISHESLDWKWVRECVHIIRFPRLSEKTSTGGGGFER